MLLQVDTLIHLGVTSQVQSALDKGLTHYPESLSLWLAKLQVTMATIISDDQVETVVEQALDKVKENVSFY
jgi:hypothetical protein